MSHAPEEGLTASYMVNTQTHGDAEGVGCVDERWNEAVGSFWAWRATECCGYDYGVAGLEATMRTEIQG
jgi:hypothetical protein